MVIKRGVKQRINEAELMGWIDEQCDKAMSPRTDKILKRAQEMAAPTMERGSDDHQRSEVVKIVQEPQPRAQGESSLGVQKSAC